jgi:uncharacterized delta-60 repeat protein
MKQVRPPIGISARALPALVACGLALALPSAAQARPGDLDRTFSGDGRVTTRFDGGDVATAIGVQEDRRIVAVGKTFGTLALARYLPDGSLDPSFGDAGRVRGTDFGVDSDFGFPAEGNWDGAIDADGRIVLSGSSRYQQPDGPHVRTVVARFTPSGELDGSFAVDGVRRINRVDGEDSPRDLELKRDGSIIVAGTAGPRPGKGDFAVLKLTPEGDLDQAFGDGGVRVIHTRGNDYASGVGVDRRNRITVGGFSRGHASLARLKPSGALDRLFSRNGRKILNRLGDAAGISKIAVKPGGAIFATGTTYQYRDGRANTNMFLAKVRSDGSMSRKFGRRGTRTIDIGRTDDAYDLALQADGKIVVGGASGLTFHSRFAVLRLTRHGRLDRRFSRNGITLTRFPSNLSNRRCGCIARALTLQPNGKIILAGRVLTNEERDSIFALARYKNDGLPAGG